MSGKQVAGAVTKVVKTAIDWDGLAKVLVSDEARKEFSKLRTAFNDVNRQIETKYCLEPEPIDWAYYKKEIGPVVDEYKKAYDSIKIPKFEDTVTPAYMPKFEALLVELKEAEEKSLKESERIEKELARLEELKNNFNTMTVNEYLDKHPELRKKFEDEIRNDNFGY